MKRILAALVVLLWASSAWAQLPLTGAGKGKPGGAAPAYSGPGDLVAGVTAWWGIRAFNAAGRGTKVANICNSTGGTDVGCADFNSDATTGIIESKLVSGITCPGANCTVKILYDQSGALSCTGTTACDASQATVSSRPLLVASCIGSLPCMTFNGSQTLSTGGSSFPTLTLPNVISAVVQRTGSFTTLLAILGSNVSFEVGFGSSVNTVAIYNGSPGTAAATDSVFHAVQYTVNGTSSEGYIDGSALAISAGSSGAGMNTLVILGGGALGDAVFSGTEFGAWPTSLSTGNKSSLNSNQHSVWGF
jgi:hypothetical protein